MKTRRILVISAAAMVALVSISSQSAWWPFSNKDVNSAGETTELWWDDLIPDDFEQPENPFATMSQEEVDRLMDGSDESNAELAKLEASFNYAPVVDELDGKRVKIPAYITPLEFNNQSHSSEFLLVPYVGACIHTPPPPANQIVHALSKEPVEMPGVYEPVWAIGILRTETIKSELAESGYKLEVEEVFPYTQE